MFRCECCNKLSKPGEKSYTIVIEKRPKTYHVEYTKIIIKRRPGKGKRKKKIHVKKVTSGWEIVRELRVCLDCYNKLKDNIQNA